MPRDGAGREQLGNLAEVQIRAADPAIGDLHDHLARTWVRLGLRNRHEAAILGDFDQTHSYSLPAPSARIDRGQMPCLPGARMPSGSSASLSVSQKRR